MRSKLLVIGIAIALVSTTIGMSAFTSAKVTRDAKIDVVTDQNALIALEDGTSGSLIQQNSSGAITIDLTRSGASGANVAAHFEFGNTSSPTTQMAFNLTNNAGESLDFTIDYVQTTDDGNQDANVKFKFYNSTGSLVATATDESSATLSNVASGTTYHVVVIIDTYGLDASTVNLSGTLKITV